MPSAPKRSRRSYGYFVGALYSGDRIRLHCASVHNVATVRRQQGSADAIHPPDGRRR